nr:MAG TPA: hypothetical protein [Caudoviricetes sp.]
MKKNIKNFSVFYLTTQIVLCYNINIKGKGE